MNPKAFLNKIVVCLKKKYWLQKEGRTEYIYSKGGLQIEQVTGVSTRWQSAKNIFLSCWSLKKKKQNW
jgi:hypothetical protein